MSHLKRKIFRLSPDFIEQVNMNGKLFKYEGLKPQTDPNRVYKVMGECKMKHPETREWVLAVMYTDGVQNYVRQKSEFLVLFKEHKPEIL